MCILFQAHRFPLTFDTMLASGDITGIRKMSRLQSQTYYAPSISGGGGGPHGGTNKFDRQRNLTLKSKSSRGTVEPLGRSSLRSKSSSNSSGDRVKLFKNCVKKIFLFLFTQVGVGAFVVLYTIAGALIFQVSYQVVVKKCYILSGILAFLASGWPQGKGGKRNKINLHPKPPSLLVHFLKTRNKHI